MSMSRETPTVSETGGKKGVKAEQFDQIPIEALFEVARHYGAGAAKYDAHQFRLGYEWSKSFNALMRHAFQFWNGESEDAETGTHHMAAVVWHALNLITLEREHPELDDRYLGEYKEHKALDPAFDPRPRGKGYVVPGGKVEDLILADLFPSMNGETSADHYMPQGGGASLEGDEPWQQRLSREMRDGLPDDV